MIRDPVAVFVVLALVVFVAVYLERRMRAVRAIGSILTAIVLAALLSNLGIIPSASPAYDRLGSTGVNLGIALIPRVGSAAFYFTLIVVGLHGLLLFGIGRLLRLDLRTLTVASQANVGGPASAMAIATARGYSDLIVPGVAVGLLGYAVGNYAGFAVAGVMRTLFAG